ncbi:pyrroloquinoline quinone biosynthesis protein PqqD [Prevotella jejuni]|uniref:Coenzyme PQQ synthesis protein D (PqqD) n=1 Tax=Prevotella jejuni TaxID=1177574 RepID=A0A2K9HCW5_9BACT|nr:PqqD family protein [Prevotella jejuni]AUI54665.1 pyrroloquinoline quinone biosynthesis protein PqqD [Prevotella jejuni]SNR94721.1 Coenzyme PQQ synthesis protein D (PqqD) [Prevotella jejuni]
MKVKNGFNLREVCGEHIIVAEGDENIDFSNIISMNESSAYLWEEVQKMGTFTVDNLVELICNQYEIDEATARKDAVALAAQWGTAGIIEGDDIPEDQSTNEKELTAETKDDIKEDVLKQESKPKKKGLFKRLFG